MDQRSLSPGVLAAVGVAAVAWPLGRLFPLLGAPVLALALVIAAATVATAASVAVCGIIGWVGLIVPHIARLVAGAEFSRLLPLAAVFGAILLLVVDTLARAASALELPPGILTAFIGTPLFLALLARRRP
jgi:iron complex transport system permease protein